MRRTMRHMSSTTGTPPADELATYCNCNRHRAGLEGFTVAGLADTKSAMVQQAVG